MSEQRSMEWLYERCGLITASRFKDVLARKKNGEPGAERETYMWELAIERLTGQPAEHYTSAAMGWGIDNEPFARMAYEEHASVIVLEVGFSHHPQIENVGGSVDGLVGEFGIWESKSPFNSRYHLQTILDGMPVEHTAQCQGLLWVTGRKWCDFTSYDPRMPEHLKLYVQRIERDDEYIDKLAEAIAEFEQELTALVGRVRRAG